MYLLARYPAIDGSSHRIQLYKSIIYCYKKEKGKSILALYFYLYFEFERRNLQTKFVSLYFYIYILVKEYFSFLTKASLKRLSNIYFKFGKNIFTQVAGIRMGCDPDPFLFTNLYFGSEKLRERIWYVLDGLPMYFVSSMI